MSDHDRGDDASGVPLRVLCNGTVMPAKETPVTCCRDRVGAPHLRHDRRAEDARSQLRQPDGAHRQRLGQRPPTSCGARSTTFAGMGAPDLSPGRPGPRHPSCFPAPASRSGDYLVRLGAHGATHVSGTPSHWRRALMSPDARAIAPRYIRLSGEIADQGILNALHSFYPQASVGHAFASTEARRGIRSRRWSRGVSGEHGRRARRRADQGRTKARCGSVPRGMRLRYVGEDTPRSPMTTASSTPATWWNAAATGTTSSVDGAASSTSAD